LKELKEYNKLQALDLSFTQVTEAGLKELKACKNLQTLNLTRTPALSDAGLRVLVEMSLLHTLIQARGEGGKRPKEIAEIRSLDLTFTAVTDAGLKELAKCPNLQALNLSYTTVSDDGLRNLKGCKNLQLLYLEGTAVTEVGQKELEAALPKVVVAR
jgi:hypothetical protein